MDSKRIVEWFKNFDGYVLPPGCESSLVSMPRNECGRVGIVHEHRFAFYFWGRYSIDKNSPHAILISIDAHDDTGVPSEVTPNDLNNLNIHNRTELALFAWLKLRSLNDGHILPALYLNFFSDVYILLSDRKDSHDIKKSCPALQQEDRNGHIHKIKFYQEPQKLLDNLPKSYHF